jgi:hypothetical protein
MVEGRHDVSKQVSFVSSADSSTESDRVSSMGFSTLIALAEAAKGEWEGGEEL